MLHSFINRSEHDRFLVVEYFQRSYSKYLFANEKSYNGITKIEYKKFVKRFSYRLPLLQNANFSKCVI